MGASPEPHSRIEDLRAWVAQLDRSLGIRTYLLGAAAVLGLAASAVALVLVLQLKDDSSTKESRTSGGSGARAGEARGGASPGG